jgi:hypothetical protein
MGHALPMTVKPLSSLPVIPDPTFYASEAVLIRPSARAEVVDLDRAESDGDGESERRGRGGGKEVCLIGGGRRGERCPVREREDGERKEGGERSVDIGGGR